MHVIIHTPCQFIGEAHGIYVAEHGGLPIHKHRNAALLNGGLLASQADAEIILLMGGLFSNSIPSAWRSHKGAELHQGPLARNDKCNRNRKGLG